MTKLIHSTTASEKSLSSQLKFTLSAMSTTALVLTFLLAVLPTVVLADPGEVFQVVVVCVFVMWCVCVWVCL